MLPEGTVTFLFTDIEGSTRLWEEKTTAMQFALARHDQILQSAVKSHQGGLVVPSFRRDFPPLKTQAVAYARKLGLIR